MQYKSDAQYLHAAARLALRGWGRVEPNPLVGCVIVDSAGNIIGRGHHTHFGGPHAEAAALRDLSLSQTAGATVYVTLEPCNAHGSNPPCAQALIDARVGRVVYAATDPNPLKQGGAATLIAAGIPATLCRQSALASGLSDPFRKRITSGLPWTIAKWAQTIDGRIATRTGESKWISNELSRRRVHQLRGRVDAILTGIGTVLADDPLLTPRGVHARKIPMRVVVDSDLETPPTSKIVTTASQTPTLLACDELLVQSSLADSRKAALLAQHVRLVPGKRDAAGHRLDLRTLLHDLHTHWRINTLMVEAGPGLLGSLFEDDLVDEAVVYIAPLLLGDELAKSVAVGRLAASLSAARKYKVWRVKQLGDDLEVTYRRVQPAGLTAT